MMSHRPHASMLASLLIAATPAAADVNEGDTCTAQEQLDVRVRNNQALMVLPIEPGEPIEILSLNESRARIRSNDITGVVQISDLERACRPAARQCQLKSPVTIEQVPDGTGRRWKIKTGALLTVVDKLPAFSRVTIGPVQGYVPSDELAEVCVAIETKTNLPDTNAPAASATSAPERPRTPVALPPVKAGTSIVIAPLCMNKGASGDLVVDGQLEPRATSSRRRGVLR